MPIHFNKNDEQHKNFIFSSTQLFAFIFGIKVNKNSQELADIAEKCIVEEFKPKKLVAKGEEIKEESYEDDSAIV